MNWKFYLYDNLGRLACSILAWWIVYTFLIK